MKEQPWDRALRRKQLDRTLGHVGQSLESPRPQRGWIREIRESLGMSARQLGARIGVSQPTVSEFEKREVAGTITLGSLERVAAALDCRLVYALVPLESLDEMLRNRARQVAIQTLEGVEHSMRLEDQANDGLGRRLRIEQEADMLLRTRLRELWDETA